MEAARNCNGAASHHPASRGARSSLGRRGGHAHAPPPRGRCRGEARRIGIGQPLITNWSARSARHGQAEAYAPGAADLGLAEATAPTPCSVEDAAAAIGPVS